MRGILLLVPGHLLGSSDEVIMVVSLGCVIDGSNSLLHWSVPIPVVVRALHIEYLTLWG